MSAIRRFLPGLSGGVILLAFLIMAGLFATRQSIWIDETTQLSGLALPFAEQLRWLIGQSSVQLGVPADRMPPLSYWIGGLWSSVFGLSEMSMRWFGIIALMGGVPAFYLSGRMRGGQLAGQISGLFAIAFVMLAPNTLVMAGEIRAYPLFLTFAAWSVFAYLRCLDDDAGDRSERLALLSVLLVFSAYTHFFGVVLAGSLYTGLLITRLLSAKSPVRVMLAGAATGAMFAGLAPFVLAAIAKSGGGEAAPGNTLIDVAANLVRLVFRLFLHGSHAVYPVVLILTGLALAGLFLMVVIKSVWVRSTDRAYTVQSIALIIPLALAGLVLPVIDFFVGSFDVLAPHYNLWMLPLAAAFIGGAFAHREAMGWPVPAASILGVAAIAGHVSADVTLLRHASLYSHGPGEWVHTAWAAEPDYAVIHDGTGIWGQAYFPLHYLSKGEAVQLLLETDGTLSRILPDGRETITDAPAFLSGFEGVMRVRVENLSNADLAKIVRGRLSCKTPPPQKFPEAGGIPETRGIAEAGNIAGTPPKQFCAYAGASLAQSQ